MPTSCVHQLEPAANQMIAVSPSRQPDTSRLARMGRDFVEPPPCSATSPTAAKPVRDTLRPPGRTDPAAVLEGDDEVDQASRAAASPWPSGMAWPARSPRIVPAAARVEADACSRYRCATGHRLFDDVLPQYSRPPRQAHRQPKATAAASPPAPHAATAPRRQLHRRRAALNAHATAYVAASPHRLQAARRMNERIAPSTTSAGHADRGRAARPSPRSRSSTSRKPCAARSTLSKPARPAHDQRRGRTGPETAPAWPAPRKRHGREEHARG